MKKIIYFILIFLMHNVVNAQTLALYGLTTAGGQFGDGTMFKYYPANDSLVKIIDFDSVNGALPYYAQPVQGTDGKIYGTTFKGGANNTGVIFSYDMADDSFSKIYDFDFTNGMDPAGKLVQFSDGNFYGLASLGGANGVGAIFAFNPETHVYTKQYDFLNNDSDGNFPTSSLALMDGKLFGSTYFGGTSNAGVLFEYSPQNMMYKIDHEFIDVEPVTALVQANGTFYGGTEGTSVPGYLYKFSPVEDSVITGQSFTNFVPTDLVVASDGNLYGLTTGYIYQDMVKPWLYKMDITNGAVTIEHVFDSIAGDGNDPQGGLIQAYNGLLYGMTDSGGANNGGVIFSYNYNTQTYIKLKDLNANTGYGPQGALLEVDETTGINKLERLTNLELYPNPASNQITIQMPGLTQEATLKVMDLTGRIVLSHYESAANKFVLNIETLSAGAYLVELRQNSLIYTGKFVKMN